MLANHSLSLCYQPACLSVFCLFVCMLGFLRLLARLDLSVCLYVCVSVWLGEWKQGKHLPTSIPSPDSNDDGRSEAKYSLAIDLFPGILAESVAKEKDGKKSQVWGIK